MRQLLDTPLDEIDCDRLRAVLAAAGDDDDRWEAQAGALRPEHREHAMADAERVRRLSALVLGAPR